MTPGTTRKETPRSTPTAGLAMVTLDCTGPDHALGFGRVEGYAAPSRPNEHGSKQFLLDPSGHPFCLTNAASRG